MANSLKGQPYNVVAISPGREVVIKGTVLEVKNGTLYLAVTKEENLSVKARQGASGGKAGGTAKGNRDGVNTRSFFRIPISVLGKAGSGRPEVACTFVNISGGGVCFRSHLQFQLNEQIQLEIPLLENQTFHLGARVVRTRVSIRNMTEYGCQFLRMSNRDEEALMGAIFKLQRPKRA